jgi:hypothetical protein
MLEMLAGGALVAAGYLIGRYMPGRRRTPKPPRAVPLALRSGDNDMVITCHPRRCPATCCP